MPTLTIDQSFAPASHTDSNWLARHRFAFDTTCAGCHTVTKPTTFDNSSFCGNSGCHASDWRYLQLNSPKILALTNVLSKDLPTYPAAPLTWQALVGPILAARCSACHGEASDTGFDVTNYTALFAGKPGGPVVVPGQADASPLVQVQRQGHPNQLPANALDWVIQWINAGAPQ